MTFARVVASWTFGPNCHDIHQLCRMQSQLLWNMEFVLLEGNMELIASAEGSLCFSWWQGLAVHTPLLPAPCGFSTVEWLPQKPYSSIREWEKAQGLPAVILIKHMLPRGKTQPVLVKDGPNPALKPLRGQGPPGLVLVSHPQILLVPVAPAAWPGASPRRKIPRESQTWTSQQIKWNATEPRA